MKKLRKEMILAVFLIIAMVFGLVLGAVNLALSIHNKSSADRMTDLIVEYDGSLPNKNQYDKNGDAEEGGSAMFRVNLNVDDETAYRTRYFLVYTDTDGTVTDTSLDHIASVDIDDADTMAKQVLAEGKTTGYMEQFYYKVTEDEDGKTIIFLDCSAEQESKQLVLEILGGILVFLCLLVTLLFGLFSGRIIRPFEENDKLQKRFITDASHELKTPLAVISANADVMKYKYGDSAWLDNITDQTKQMAQLIGDLLALTKADEIGSEFAKEQVDLGTIVHETWDTFAETAAGKHVTMTMDVPQTLTMEGNTDMLKKLLSVLSENASKYVTEGGQMSLTIKNTSRKITLQMYNTAEVDPDMDCSHLFDRFYRPDSSRTSSTGGHGIGLSIAKKIVDNHKGTITAEKYKDGIRFTVVLPR